MPTPPPRLARFFRLAAVCVLACCGRPFAAAQPAPLVNFEVPAGEASVTLKQFSEQSGQTVVYLVDIVRGVPTAAVKGRYTPREALDRMIAGTALNVVQDARTGALAVRKGTADPNGSRAAPLQADGSRPGPNATDEEPITLSPFVISDDKDHGYSASSTLAGSRIKSPLKDVAAQISVFTPELMEDLGLTNLQEVYLYSTNVESYLEYTPGGDLGVGVGSLSLVANNQRSDSRIRGLGAVTILRSFFETSFDLETYNTDRVTIASGPNAILFGLGNAGGVTDASLKQAEFRRRASLSTRWDNFDGHRLALDVNHVLWPKKAALRLAALDANNRTFRPQNNDVNRRLYGAVTLRPLPNTTVRLNAEWVQRDASRASTVVVHDYVSPWLDGGRPTFDNSGLTSATAAATVNARITAAGLSPVLTRSGNNSMVFTTGNTAGTQPVANWLNSANVVGIHTKAPVLQDQAYEWSLVRPEIFNPYANIYGDGNLVRERGRILNAFIEQKITPDLYLEGGFVKEQATTRQGSWVDGNNSFDIFVDANRYLPDGTTPNPNLGKLYSQTNPLGNRRWDDRQESRLTASYQLDFTGRPGLLAGLGRHRLAAMYSYSEYTTTAQASRLIIAGSPSFLSAAARNNLADTSRRLTVRTYLGNGVEHVSAPVPGGALDFKPTLNLAGPGGEPFEARMYHNPDGSATAASGTEQNVISRSLADQVYLLRNRLIATYGWRESRVRMKTALDAASTTAQANGLFPNVENTRFANEWDYFDNGQSINWGLVGRPLSWLSLHYAESENFAIQASTWFDPFGRPIPGSNGTGKDYGFSVNLDNGKLNLRVNRYVNDQKNSRPDNTISALRTIPMNIEKRILEVAPATPLLGMDFNRYANANYQVTNTSEATGYDIEMAVNPTANWRGVLNVGRQRTVTQIDDTWWTWVEQRLPVWKTFGAGWDVERITAASAQTIHNQYDQWVATQRDPLVATNGIVVANQREWRVSGILTYVFTEGRLRGATAGLGGRWRSPNNLGYQLTTLASGQRVLDLTRPFKGSTELAIDTFATYSLRKIALWRLKSDWKLQLNVRNLFDERGLFPTQVLTTGAPSIFTFRSPRQFILSLQLEL